ncbi:Putative predicted metal-dependent hydrolase [Rubrivivax sp. A210]|uniref:M48 family metallopeptidase n=1 Tax=Rubrivivax sp. A210 TaxID=2772301 RepID=UPI001919732B|nr:SprT family zinc-dependent metalloprotease [Rubrivivax sp. A210]CAD5366514.1 Putative predicted metal-dependent hydrolase [Rubrivivax sp. A210]
MSTLTVNDLRFDVRRSSRRRALEITVDRGGELILSAPPEVPDARLREFVQRKRMWVYQQLARKDALGREAPRKAFVDGEGFVYLGRSYRLRLVPEADAAVKLLGGRLVMPQALARDGREHLIRWYTERARPWLTAKVQDYAARMEVNPAGLRVQDLGYRWGSCGKGEVLYFHWKTILLPAQMAEYVVVHEMAHLHERHHTPGFWLRVERAMPDYERRKAWLGARGIEVEGL